MQAERIDHDMDLRRGAAHEVDAGHARDPQHAGLDLVAGGLPKVSDVAGRAGEAHSDDGRTRHLARGLEGAGRGRAEDRRALGLNDHGARSGNERPSGGESVQ